jgi:hypothetical protein
MTLISPHSLPGKEPRLMKNPDSAIKIKVVKATQLERHTAEQWREKGIVVVAGSYISTFAPTNLPSGTMVCDELWNMIFGRKFAEWLKRDFRRVPFEAVMQCYPHRTDLRSIVSRMFWRDLGNPIHAHLSDSLEKGFIHAVITTNYDLGFESCLARFPGTTVVDDEETLERHRGLRNASDSIPKTCFKIHGTVSKEETLVYDLEKEGRLQKWKESFLAELVKDRVIIAIGYSGRDFDICPELSESTHQAHVVWLQPKWRDVSPNAKRVLTRRSATLVEGDLIPFLEKILDTRIESCQRIPLQWNPREYFDDSVVKQWRVNVLDWMACGRVGLVEMASLNCKHADLLKMEAAMYGHIGRYRDVVKTLHSMLDEPGLTERESAEIRIEMALRNFIYGRQLQAWNSIRKLEKKTAALGSSVGAQLMEVKMTMLMRAGYFTRRFAWLTRHVRAVAQQIYDKLRPELEEVGAWRRLQGLQQNAERIGIANMRGLPLPSKEGYASLGLVSMDAITKRDQLRALPWKLDIHRLVLARACLLKAERYGWEHEAWKLNWILIWRGGSKRRYRHLIGWLRHFLNTQYPLLMRFLQLAMTLKTSSQNSALTDRDDVLTDF